MIDPAPMTFGKVVLASFQPSEYLRAAFQTKGGLRFLVTWLGLVCLVFGLLSAVATTAFVKEAGARLDAAPEFKLADGKLVVEGPQPVRIDEPSLHLVIDTTGATKIDDVAEAPIAVFVGADRVVVRDAAGQRELRYADAALPPLDKAGAKSALVWLPMAMFAWNLLGWGFWIVVAWVFTALAGNLATIASKGRVHPLMGMRMSAHAFAIPLVVGVSPLSFPGLWPAVFATGSLLTWLGGRAAGELPMEPPKPHVPREPLTPPREHPGEASKPESNEPPEN